jgi:signal transduction histidine kinase
MPGPARAGPGAATALWLGQWVWIPGWTAATALVIPLFPDGRPASRGWAWLACVGAVFAVVATVVTLPLVDVVPATPVPAPDAARPVLLGLALGCWAGTTVCALVGAAALVVRGVRRVGAARCRVLWFFVGFATLVLTGTLPVGTGVQLAGTALFPVTVGIAMLRYGLFDADRLLSRTLLYGTLTLLVGGLVTGCLAASLAWAGEAGPGAVAASVAVVVALAQVRDAVQRAVDRLLYGQRRDPYGALTSLSRRLSGALAPTEMLTVVVDTVTTALRLPYAAVTVQGDPLPAVSAGRRPEQVLNLPLIHAGEHVGVLCVGYADGGPTLDGTDERLLADVARQAGSVAHAVHLTRRVQIANDRSATARDTERHRIRRDLHDHLGPSLAGVALGLGAVRRAVAERLPDQQEPLALLQAHVQAALDDVKRLIADLRPTLLDELGLAEALRRHAGLLSADDAAGPRVLVTVDGLIPVLPSDVEVAAYRICLEALTNATRHADPRQVHLRLGLDGEALVLRVEDDGVGLPSAPATIGLGLASMTARALDLGGTCTIGNGVGNGLGSGAVVEARLPLRRPQ